MLDSRTHPMPIDETGAARPLAGNLVLKSIHCPTRYRQSVFPPALGADICTARV
jgi:hypothetical protein